MEPQMVDYYNEMPSGINVIDKMNEELDDLQKKYNELEKKHTEYVKLQDSYQRRGANLRRNIGLSRTLDSLHQSHTLLLRENEFLQQELSRYTSLSTITIPCRSQADLSTREKISSIQDVIFDLKKQIPDGPYLELMNKAQEIFKQT